MEHNRIIIAPSALASLPTPVIAAAIDQLIETLDARTDDPDLEDSEAGETAITDRGRFLGERTLGDAGGGEHCINTRDADGEQAWPEWSTRGRHKGGNPNQQVRGTWGYHEDDEDADRDSCLAADDDPARHVSDSFPGDRDDDEDSYDREETRDQDEVEQMQDDVPCLRVMALEPNPFDGKRHYLGIDNLQPSFVDNGSGVLCAETGRTQYRNNRSGGVRYEASDDPETLPDLYASTCVGRCLEPRFKDGVCLVFSKTEKPKAGDYVGIFFKPGVMPAGQLTRWVKRLTYDLPPDIRFPYAPAPSSGVEPLVIVEALNPPRRFTFRASQILAVHKVVGEATSHGSGLASFAPNKFTP